MIKVVATFLFAVLNIGLFFFSSCGLVEENDLDSQNCFSKCTYIRGRLTTENRAKGIDNAKLVLIWSKREYLMGGIVRKKAITKTNDSGYFEIKFSINDDELEDGLFEIQYFIDRSRFLVLDEGKFGVFGLKKDTAFNINYLVPRKAFIKWELVNGDKIGKLDYYATSFNSNMGHEGTQGGYIVSWSSGLPLKEEIEVAAEQPLYINTVKLRDGLRSERTDTVIISQGEGVFWKFDFDE